MMKIKIFEKRTVRQTAFQALEEEVNAWLKDNNKFVAIKSITPIAFPVLMVITIVYESTV